MDFFLSTPALLVLIGALLLSVLLYLKNFRKNIVQIVMMCVLLVFLYALFSVSAWFSIVLGFPGEVISLICLPAWLSSSQPFILLGALLLGMLFYVKDLKGKIVAAANLCLMLVFVYSLYCVIDTLVKGIEGPRENAATLLDPLILTLYAGVINLTARVCARVIELVRSRKQASNLPAETA